jgi:hypothetical protein
LGSASRWAEALQAIVDLDLDELIVVGAAARHWERLRKPARVAASKAYQVGAQGLPARRSAGLMRVALRARAGPTYASSRSASLCPRQPNCSRAVSGTTSDVNT